MLNVNPEKGTTLDTERLAQIGIDTRDIFDDHRPFESCILTVAPNGGLDVRAFVKNGELSPPVPAELHQNERLRDVLLRLFGENRLVELLSELPAVHDHRRTLLKGEEIDLDTLYSRVNRRTWFQTLVGGVVVGLTLGAVETIRKGINLRPTPLEGKIEDVALSGKLEDLITLRAHLMKHGTSRSHPNLTVKGVDSRIGSLILEEMRAEFATPRGRALEYPNVIRTITIDPAAEKLNRDREVSPVRASAHYSAYADKLKERGIDIQEIFLGREKEVKVLDKELVSAMIQHREEDISDFVFEDDVFLFVLHGVDAVENVDFTEDLRVLHAWNQRGGIAPVNRKNIHHKTHKMPSARADGLCRAYWNKCIRYAVEHLQGDHPKLSSVLFGTMKLSPRLEHASRYVPSEPVNLQRIAGISLEQYREEVGNVASALIREELSDVPPAGPERNTKQERREKIQRLTDMQMVDHRLENRAFEDQIALRTQRALVEIVALKLESGEVESARTSFQAAEELSVGGESITVEGIPTTPENREKLSRSIERAEKAKRVFEKLSLPPRSSSALDIPHTPN